MGNISKECRSTNGIRKLAITAFICLLQLVFSGCITISAPVSDNGSVWGYVVLKPRFETTPKVKTNGASGDGIKPGIEFKNNGFLNEMGVYPVNYAKPDDQYKISRERIGSGLWFNSEKLFT